MITKAILLDGAQGLLIIIPIAFVLHMVLTVLIEGLILLFFKYGTYRKCTLDVLLANFISLVLGLVSTSFFISISFNSHHSTINLIVLLLLFYFETVIIEGIVLKSMNKKFEIKKLIPAIMLMNLATYIPIYLILKWTGADT